MIKLKNNRDCNSSYTVIQQAVTNEGLLAQHSYPAVSADYIGLWQKPPSTTRIVQC